MKATGWDERFQRGAGCQWCSGEEVYSVTWIEGAFSVDCYCKGKFGAAGKVDSAAGGPTLIELECKNMFSSNVRIGG